MNRRSIILPAVAAGSVALLSAVGIASALAPSHTTAPSAVVTTTQEPAGAATEHLAPRCFETSVNGTQDCAWVPVAACLTDEDGDDAIPSDYDGCFWDAGSHGNRRGASYVIWRGGRG